MGERKGVNKYYPPDYDPEKGGLNKFLGTHALRERARKLHLGILIIRFELPFNIWCDGCGNHIGTGVRYNAEKKKVGMYYSTPIYQFRMKCHLCDNHFEIKTDPANLDYVIVCGARRQERRWDPDDNEQIAPEDKAVTRKLAQDAMFKLEHGVADENKSKDIKTSLTNLEDFQRCRWQDDYSANQALRERMRETRTQFKVQKARDDLLNLNVSLLPASEEDDKIAKLLQYTQVETSQEKKEKKRNEINNQSVFNKTKSSTKDPKKKFAHQSLKELIISNRKSPSPASGSLKARNLGIRKRNDENFNQPGSSETVDNVLTKESKSNNTLGVVSYESSESD